VVLVCAGVEWREVLAHAPGVVAQPSPAGEWLETAVADGGRAHRVVFVHAGVGKIRSAAATQYAVQRWHPPLVVNLGTCGGFAGVVRRGETVLATRTVVYDMVDRTGGTGPVLDGCQTTLDLSWLGEPFPAAVRPGPMLSADRDLLPEDIARLRATHQGVAADWESAAIAYVAQANARPVLILRGVSDLVSDAGGEAYGDPAVFETGARDVMRELLRQLPLWLSRWPAR
jgi:adenosylhomocysteine nucleosidase